MSSRDKNGEAVPPSIVALNLEPDSDDRGRSTSSVVRSPSMLGTNSGHMASRRVVELNKAN